MSKLYIHIVNSTFHGRDGGGEYDKPADALIPGIDSAVAIAVDEIHKGSANAAVEVRIEQADGTLLLRSVLSLSISNLMSI